MSKPRFAKWHNYLRSDFATLIKDLPLDVEQVLFKKSTQLITSDDNGFKLCLAVSLTHLVRLPVIDDKVLRQLHLLYLCAWLAYSIYDDINDQETKSKLLPIANYLLFLVFEISKNLQADFHYQNLLLDHFKEMELANYRELHLSHYEPYPKELLFKRASGQLFGLHVLSDNWHLDLRKRKQLFELMEMLISILQIQDDLRDCFSDYSTNKFTYVNQELFRQNFSDQETIRSYFYQKILPKILDDLELRLSKARGSLKKLPEFDFQDGFFNFILSSREKILVNDKFKSFNFGK